MAAAYARAGDIDKATWEADPIRIMYPDFSVERVKRLLPFNDATDRGHFFDGLRRAGR
jgi:hypothetical protein